jgi:hypothetical protein
MLKENELRRKVIENLKHRYGDDIVGVFDFIYIIPQSNDAYFGQATTSTNLSYRRKKILKWRVVLFGFCHLRKRKKM